MNRVFQIGHCYRVSPIFRRKRKQLGCVRNQLNETQFVHNKNTLCFACSITPYNFFVLIFINFCFKTFLLNCLSRIQCYNISVGITMQISVFFLMELLMYNIQIYYIFAISLKFLICCYSYNTVVLIIFAEIKVFICYLF